MAMEDLVGEGWEGVLERCLRSVVVVRVSSTRSFDTNHVNYSKATGFVVDAERGLILSNRHVVGPGPTLADGLFQNHEEIELLPLYRDPIHDFGFYKYNPTEVKHLKPLSIALVPEKAKVGLKIRVVGNDAGDKLSILQGTIARLDRPAPYYGSGRYTDFNTFYLQAASSTSGGSSGSPVLDMEGNAVGLNAGGKKSGASSYYFPLDRVKRVLNILQGGLVLREGVCLTPEGRASSPSGGELVGEGGEKEGKKGEKEEKFEWKGGKLPEIPRGTLQTIFKHEPYDEVSRLGLKEETQTLFRKTFKDSTGVLVVDQVVPEGPGAKGGLLPGDILIRVNGELVDDFVTLEAMLDDRVGGEVEVEVERAFETVVVKLQVQDLHSITPSMFFQVSRSVLHPLSYQQARHYNFPVGAVYVASAGYMFSRVSLPSKAILESINHVPIPTIDDAIRVFSGLKDKERFVLKYFGVNDPHRKEVTVCTMDRRWSSMCRYHRDDMSGLWEREIVGGLGEVAPPPPPARVTAKEGGVGDLGGVDVGKVGKALVLVTFSVPVNVDGYASSEYVGTGIIVDKKKGLVLVDRGTIPHPIGDIVLIFSESVRLDGSVVFIHPTHNFSIISYDPTCLAEGSDVEEVDVMEGEQEGKKGGWGKGGLKQGEEVVFVGLWSLNGASASTVSMKTKITSLQELEVRPFDPPMYRQTNLDAIHVEQMINNSGGALLKTVETDEEEEIEGKEMNGVMGNGVLNGERRKKRKVVMAAMWAFFSFPDEDDIAERSLGLPAAHFAPIIQMLRAGKKPEFRCLQGELWPISLADARSHGLSQENIELIQQHSTRRVLTIRGITQGASAGKYLKVGDILISIDGQIVTTFLDVERLSQKETLEIKLLRDGKEMILSEVPTDRFDGIRRSSIIIWAGALIQEPHREVLEGYGGEPPKALYVSRYFFGTPAQKYCLRASRYISEIDGCPVSTVKELRDVIARIPEGEFVRVKTLGARTFKPKVLTLRVDYHYWATVEVKYDPETNTWGGAEVEMHLEDKGEK